MAGGVADSLTEPSEKWSCREWSLLLTWLLLSVVFSALPFLFVGCVVPEESATSECRPFLHASWAVSGGLLAGLIRILHYQIESQKLEPKIKRALRFEPLLAALVALGAYVFAQLGLFSLFRVGDPTAHAHAFFRIFALGLVAGLFWGAVLKRLGEWLRS